MKIAVRLYINILLVILTLSSLSVGCRNNRSLDYSSEKAVLTTVSPIADLVNRIAGGKVRVETLVPLGTEPENFSPTPSMIHQMASCHLFFRVGLASEISAAERLKTANPKMRIVDLREFLEENPIFHQDEDHHEAHEDEESHLDDQDESDIEASEENEEENNHHTHHHAHHCGCGEGIDPHLWMSPSLLVDMAQGITVQLIELTPENREFYNANLAAFCEEIGNLQAEIQGRLEPLTHRTIYVFHPAYGYYCREFNLAQKSIEEGGKSPKTKALVDLIREIRSEEGAILLAQPEFDQTTVQKISEAVPIKTAYHSPLGNDCVQNLRDLTDLIAPRLQNEGIIDDEMESKEE